MKLSDFQALSFDCYGTLIDWETGIHTALTPLLSRAGSAGMGLARSAPDLSRESVLQAFARHESRQQEATPDMPYPGILAAVHRQLATEWDVPATEAEHDAFGAAVPDWPPFPDTVEALAYLKQHFRLIILSNVDRTSFAATNKRLGVTFDAIHTAQDIGSYKPDHRNFSYLLDRLREQGIPREKLLHVAQSLFHDHVPANALGIASAWIDRRHDTGPGGATAPITGDVHFDFRFKTLDELAAAHRAGG